MGLAYKILVICIKYIIWHSTCQHNFVVVAKQIQEKMQLNFFQNSMLVLLFLSYISDKVGKASDWEARRFTGFSFLTNEKSLTFSRIHPDFLEIHLNFSGIHLHFLEIYLNFFDIHLHLSESGFIFRNSSSFFGIHLHFSELPILRRKRQADFPVRPFHHQPKKSQKQNK